MVTSEGCDHVPPLRQIPNPDLLFGIANKAQLANPEPCRDALATKALLNKNLHPELSPFSKFRTHFND